MPKKNKGLQPGEVIPSFSLEGTDGKTYASEDYKGKPFLLVFLRSTF
ncbi:MAG: redoxin domain-containing protein [Bacillus sp. (in: Bacteria)]|nr:redoxin domain-containing protein [Bacillus sp. (in: firmicutes)]